MGSDGENLSPAMTRELVRRFGGRGVPLAVLGSYARDDAGPYSDIDVVRFSDDVALRSTDGSFLVRGSLVVVATASQDDAASWFDRPELIVNNVGGLRHVQALADDEGVIAALRQRAQTFRWTTELSRRADAWVGEQMVGWIEEVFKGLEGLRRDDVGRLLNARFGLSWGLSRESTGTVRGFQTNLDAACPRGKSAMSRLRIEVALPVRKGSDLAFARLQEDDLRSPHRERGGWGGCRGFSTALRSRHRSPVGAALVRPCQRFSLAAG